MKKLLIISLAASFLCSFLFSGCGENGSNQNSEGSINLDSLSISGEGLSVKNNRVTISSGGTFTASGKLDDGMIYIDAPSIVTLNLNNASISNKNGPSIYVKNAEKTNIVINEGTNNLLWCGDDFSDEFDDEEAIIFSKSDLDISGSGELNLSSKDADAIKSEKSIIINDGKISVSLGEGKGVTALGDVTVNGGEINVLSAEEGLESKKTLTINDGSIFVSTSDDGFNGGESKKDADDEKMTRGFPKERPANGEMPLPPAGDMARDSGSINKDNGGIAINGGKITIKAQGDGIDSNGFLEINSGELTVEVPGSNGGEGALDSDSAIAIYGGTIICSGGKIIGDMRGNADGDTQSMLIADLKKDMPAGSTVVIKSSDGAEIAHFSVSTSFSQIGFSSADVVKGNIYSVFVNGEKVQELTAPEKLSVNRGPFTRPPVDR